MMYEMIQTIKEMDDACFNGIMNFESIKGWQVEEVNQNHQFPPPLPLGSKGEWN